MADAQRDRYGRYLIQPAVGNGPAEPYTRATTVAGAIDDKTNLARWDTRTTVKGLCAREDLFARVVACQADDKKQLDAICAEAKEAGGGSVGANRGTALHEATAQLDLGVNVKMPAPYDLDLLEYKRALHANRIGIDKRYVERLVILDRLAIAGTLDRLVTLPDGELVVADLKTGQSLSFQSIAMQLAIYANAEYFYNQDLGYREPMPPVSKTRALVIHLPFGQAQCVLHLVDISHGMAAVELALQVREWRKQRNLATVYAPDLGAPVPDAMRMKLIERLQAIAAHDPERGLALVAQRWPGGVPTFSSGAALDVVQLEGIAAAVDAVEQLLEVPF